MWEAQRRKTRKVLCSVRVVLLVAAASSLSSLSPLAFGRASKPAAWASAATGSLVQYEVFAPAIESEAAKSDAKPDATAKRPIIIYLKNLPARSAAVEGDEQIADLTNDGYVVITLDYARHPRAATPHINADLLKLRRETPALLAKYNVDENRLFILPAGYRLVQDVEFYRQDGRAYRMDVRWPARGTSPAPVVLQISHDNEDRRRNRAYTRYEDTLLDGLVMRGYAVATMEHMGVGTRYGKTPQMPDFIYKLKAAVRTLRAGARRFNFDSERIAALGFSKGGTAAAMLATMGGLPEFEGDGPHREQSSRVRAAVCLAGRFDFRDLEEAYTEREEWERFLRVHGHPAENPRRYAEMSPITYITLDDAPMFFFVGEADSTRPVNTRRMVLALRRAGHTPEHVEESELDHRITTRRETIEAIYRFLDKHLARPVEAGAAR